MADVVKGQAITAAQMNSKVDKESFTAFAAVLDDKFSHIVFVGTETEWNSLSSTEKNKYILRGVPR